MGEHAELIAAPLPSHGRVTGQILGVPLATVLGAVLLGMAMQYIVAAVYAGLIVEAFGGTRNTYNVTIGAIALSYLSTAVATAACALYCAKRAGPSRIIVAIHLVAVVIPLQALVAADFELARVEFATTVAAAFVLAMAVAGSLVDIELPAVSRGGRVLAVLILMAMTLYVFAALITHGGLGRLSFDLSLVYEVREEFLEEAAPFAGYLIPWQGYVLNPILMLLGYKYRRRSLLLLGLTLQLLLFAMTGFRAFLFSPLMMLALYHVGTRRQLVGMAITGALAVIVIGGGLYAIFNEPLIPSLLIYRLLIVPAEIHYWYYDFFGVHGQAALQLSQSVLSSIAPSHYSMPIAEVIGWTYMGSAASANVGLFGDAFANFGFAGCGAFALLFALVLKALDAAGRRADPRIAAALVGIPAFQLVNTGLLTTLATHGLILTILTLWVISRAPPAARATQGSGH